MARLPTPHTIQLKTRDHIERRIKLHGDGAVIRSGAFVDGIVLNVQKVDKVSRKVDGHNTVLEVDEAIQLITRLQILVTEYMVHKGTL